MSCFRAGLCLPCSRRRLRRRGGESDGKAKAGSARIDLATYDAKRWIVQLKAKPLARYARANRGIWQAGVAGRS